MAGSSVDIPIQKGLHVIAKDAVLRKSPDTAAAVPSLHMENISAVFTP